MINVSTAHGPARVELHPAPNARRALVLGHGAGGGIGAGDLLAARDAALGLGITVALVEQPYRVAGRRSPAPAAQLDAAWLAVTAWLGKRLGGLELICGGRSSGARVACRTSGAVGPARSSAWPSRYIHLAARRRPGSRSSRACRYPRWSSRGRTTRSGGHRPD